MSLTTGANLPCNHSLSLIPINAANMFVDEQQVCVICYVSPLSNCFFFCHCKGESVFTKTGGWRCTEFRAVGVDGWLVGQKSGLLCLSWWKACANRCTSRQYFAYRRCGFYINPKNRFIILFKESCMDMCTCKASMYTCMHSNMGESLTGRVLISQLAKGGVKNSNKQICWKKLPAVVEHISSYSSLISSGYQHALNMHKLNYTQKIFEGDISSRGCVHLWTIW